MHQFIRYCKNNSVGIRVKHPYVGDRPNLQHCYYQRSPLDTTLRQFFCLVPHNRSSGIHLNVIPPTKRPSNLSYSKNLYPKITYNFQGFLNRNRPIYSACCKYGTTPPIGINWDGEPYGYAENPANWIFFFK